MFIRALLQRLYRYIHRKPRGTFMRYVTFFFFKFDTHPPPHNANNVEPYIFVTLFRGNLTPSHPRRRYVTLEWPPTSLDPYNRSRHTFGHNKNSISIVWAISCVRQGRSDCRDCQRMKPRSLGLLFLGC